MIPEIRDRRAHWVPRIIVGIGVIGFLADVALEVWFFDPARLLTPESIGFNVMTLGFTGGIVAAGYWLARSDIDVGRYPRVLQWTLGVAGVFLGVNLLIMTQFPENTRYDALAWALWASYVGAAGGVTVGTFEARAIHRAVGAEREAVEAEQIEEQRQWLDYLNSLLRHEVLNNASIIQGYAALLLEEEDLEPTAEAFVETIHRQSGDMTDVIRDVRLLVQAAERIEYRKPMDVTAVLESELEDLRATYPEVTADLSVDGEAWVQADDLLARVFSNLLSNAVEHNPSASPSVSVTVATSPDAVRVTVSDDGPGVPETERETLFERGKEDHGLGLYLVRVLADRYEGEVELVETGAEGSVFAVELPRADAPADPDADAELAPAGPDEGASARRTIE